MPKAANKVTISVIVTLEEKERLKKLADTQERSISQMAAILLREGLNRQEAKDAWWTRLVRDSIDQRLAGLVEVEILGQR